ncbi:MAG TPA: hypothetical protein VLD40_01135, partial [Dissulfurispiraceae bacterium]|nr:hypothetical protein [Dissulfurispiraceae bacterium]
MRYSETILMSGLPLPAMKGPSRYPGKHCFGGGSSSHETGVQPVRRTGCEIFVCGGMGLTGMSS